MCYEKEARVAARASVELVLHIAMAPGHSEAKLGVTAHCNHDVPRALHKEEIMVEITGPATEKGKTANLDLVVVLDTSESMQGRKLQDMKQAAEFVIKKMGKLDKLTFVPFSDKAGKPKEPLCMSDDVKRNATKLVRALKAHGKTNIEQGLHTAVRILHERTNQTGRAAGIFLMTDGKQNIGEARDAPVHDLPVFTFGIGQDHDHHLLYDIAHNSHGGTYHNTPHSDVGNSLLKYFAKVLGILRDLSVTNLSVTLKPHNKATILEVHPGNYRVTSGGHGSSTIHFGDLARKEHRRFIAVIQLPAVFNNEKEKTVMEVEYSFRLPKERESQRRLEIKMARQRSARPQARSGQFQVEVERRKHAQRIAEMKKQADAKNFDMAENELAKANNALMEIERSKKIMRDLLDALKRELEHLDSLSLDSKPGSAYMLAAILSHGRQRFAARGGGDDVMLYQLPRMSKYERQADEFHRNPNAARI